MSAVHTYDVHVSREGKWWMIHVPELDALTQARRFSEVEEQARSLIATVLDVETDTFAMSVGLDAIDDLRVTERIARLYAERSEAEAAQERYRRDMHALANDLAHKGLPVRDIGSVLGVSFQRAQQLIHA